MSTKNPMAAEILEASAAGFAAAAGARLERKLNRDNGAAAEWRSHLRQRILELAAAIRVGQPELFAKRVNWLRRAMKARGLEESSLGLSLESLREALDEEMPEALRDSVTPALSSALAALGREIEPETEALSPSEPAGRLGLQYIAACLDAEPERATAMLLGALDDGMSAEDLYCKVLLPTEKEVGQLWHVGEISIAEERLVTETTFRVATLIAARCTPDQTLGKRMLAAAVPGNAHEFGLRVVTDLFALAGWRCLFLGSNVPSADIAQAVEAYRVDLVVLTATLTTQLGAVATSIADIKRLSPAVKVLVGGYPFDEMPETWRDVGADGFAARAQEAVAQGLALVTGSA